MEIIHAVCVLSLNVLLSLLRCFQCRGARRPFYHLWSTVPFLRYAQRMVGAYALEASPGLFVGVQQANVLCQMFSRGGADVQLLVCVCSSREPRVRADVRQISLPHYLFLLRLQWRALHCRETGTQHRPCPLTPPCQVARIVVRVQAPFQRMPAVSRSLHPFPHPSVC